MSSVHLACLTESVGSRQRYLMASDPKPPCPKSVCYYEDTEGIVMLLLIWQPILISFLYISTRQPLKCPCRSIPFCIVPEKKKRRGPTVTDKTKPSVLPWVSTCYLVFSYMVIVDKTTSSHRCKRHTIRYRCLPLLHRASISSCDQTKWRLNGLDMLFVPHACPTRNSGAAVAAPS